MISSGSKLSVKRQCELIGISRSTHYYQPRKPSPEATDRKEAIMAEIDRVHTEYPCYGQRRIRKLLNDAGYPVGRKLIRRYMQEMCICPIYPKPNLSKRNHR